MDFIKFRPFNLDLRQDFCRFDLLNTDDAVEKKLFREICDIAKQHDSIITNKQEFFRLLASNDCYLTLKQKYEFVAFYDTDEVIFPTNFEKSSNKSYYSCEINEKLCRLNPFSTNIYDFVENLIAMEFKGSKTEISSLNILNTNYLTSHLAYNLMNSLKEKVSVIQNYQQINNESFSIDNIYISENNNSSQIFNDSDSIDKNSFASNNDSSRQINNNSFPISVFLPLKQKFGHEFVMNNEDDYDHVLSLIELYKKVDCLNETFSNNTISDDFNKFLYFITDTTERLPRSIYYSVNQEIVSIVKLKPIYDSLETSIDVKYFNAKVSHFGGTFENSFNAIHQGSIQNLNIDLEYLLFVMKYQC